MTTTAYSVSHYHVFIHTFSTKEAAEDYVRSRLRYPSIKSAGLVPVGAHIAVDRETGLEAQ